MDWSSIFNLILNISVFVCVVVLALRSRFKSLSTEQELVLRGSGTGTQPTFSTAPPRERASIGIHTGQNNIICVCLTGGPCAGKTSVISKILSLAQVYNIQVYYHPDTLTTIKHSGYPLELSQLSASQKVSYVTTLLRLQMRTEQIFYSLAQNSQKKAVILVERGALDFKPLLGEELWQGMLNENGWKELALSDNRYHMVIHLETAASGATEMFSRWNDGHWTVESAVNLDVQLKDAWKNHHNFRSLRNMSGLRDFEKKVEEAIKDIIAYVNPASIRQHKRKYLVECDDPKTWGISNFAKYEIDTLFLKPSTDDMETEKVESRKSADGELLLIQKISRKPDPESKSVTTHRNILTPKEYLSCLIRAQANKEKVYKTRYAFIYKTHHYALSKYEKKVEWILRVLTRDEEAAIEIPQFVRMIRLLQVTEKFTIDMLHDEEVPAVPEPSPPVESDVKSDSEGPVATEESKGELLEAAGQGEQD